MTTTIYGSNVPDTILSTACQMALNSGGTETSVTTTIPSTSQPYAEFLSQGGTSTAVASLPAPTGNGFVWWCGAGSIAAGNWSAIATNSSHSKGVNTVIRFYKITSAFSYTAIGTITVNQTSTGKTTYTYSPTAMSSVTTSSGDGIYIDRWWFDNNANAGGDNPVNYVGNSATAGVAGDMQVTMPTFVPAATTQDRTIPASAALQSTLSRTIPATTALQSTLARVVPATTALQSLGNARTVPASASIAETKSRTVPATAALNQPSSRTVPATAALSQAGITRTVPATVALQSTGNARTIPATTALLQTLSRTIPATTTLANTASRTVPATAALQSTLSRSVPASAALTTTYSRTIPASVALAQPAVFYASNVAQTLGGLTQSDQISTLAGGVETSFTVTMPSSGTNSYVELLSQGGSSSATPVLPSPTGRGWSIDLAGNTILAGYWSSIFTLAKSGTTKTGASLIARFYRRTMDGTLYPIAISTLSGQSFSTTKTVYTTPSVLNSWPWQFVDGDTLYMDAFVWNGSIAWASETFTVYVSNSATQGVYGDGTIIAPEMIATSDGLSCIVGATNFQTGEDLPILDQSITIADAIDQRSIATLTGEDVDGTLSYQRAMPVQLSDSEQGLLYTGYVNSDKVSKPAAGTSNAQLEHQLTFMDNHYLVDKRKNERNYLNWSSGDMTCDFIQSTLAGEGVTGEFALESDYTPETFGEGTLDGTVATDTTSPFTYAPNTQTPPITSNTGDLELTRAGTKFTLTEQTTSDFASGTLTNMTASDNSLKPTTQKAVRFVAQFPLNVSAANRASIAVDSSINRPQAIGNYASAQIWSGSQNVNSTDTLNYDIWISSSSPAYLAGVDLLFSDGTLLSSYTYGTADTLVDALGYVGIWDQNNVSADFLADLSNYAKDAWYTRSIPLSSLSGKTVTAVYLKITGSGNGTYTIYVKNCYLGSHSGSPFFSTTATTTQVNPPTITTVGGYIPFGVADVVDVYRPALSTRISPAHSISGVGLVQNSTISWTASLPTAGTFTNIVYPPGTSAPSDNTSSSSAMLMYVSYDGTTWLPCTNQQALPGLPPGANVSGLSLYLMEQFQAGNDPTALPSLLQVNITINSAAAQTTTDVVAAYGNATAWNTGTYNGTAVNGSGDLVNGGTFSPVFTSSSSFNWTMNHSLAGGGGGTTLSASSGTLTVSNTSNSDTSNMVLSLDDALPLTNGVIECDFSTSSSGSNQWTRAGIIYRGGDWQAGWNSASLSSEEFCPVMPGYLVYIQADTASSTMYVAWIVLSGSGAPSYSSTYTTTISQGTFYHIEIVFEGDRHTIYFNNGTNAVIDMLDDTYTSAGRIGLYAMGTLGDSSTCKYTSKWKNYTCTPLATGTWTSPSISLSSLGSCGYTQIAWSEVASNGAPQSTAFVLTSLNGGSTWQRCQNGAEIPTLPPGTSVSGLSLLIRIILYSNPGISAPIITGLYARICGDYGTVSGTRTSPALNLSPVGYVAASNCMWNANVPTNTSLTVQTTQDLSTYHTVGNDGAGEALPYWTNQPDATQDLFSTNTSANYTSTNKSGGSAASVAYNTAQSQLTLAGGSSALYLNSAISCSDVDMLVDMDESDAGGMVWRKVDASNFYEVGVYDASSSSGFTNQLRLYKVASGTRTLLGSASMIFTRGTFHRPRVSMQGGLINVYWDGTCLLSYLDTSPLGSGACGLRNDGGTSRYYQLWIQPLGTNLSGQVLYTKVTMTTSDPAMMPQLFTLVACVRGPSIATGATIAQLHPVTKPVATYYHDEMDTLTQASGDYFWLVDKWRKMHFGPRLARPGAFPVQSVVDPAGVCSGYLLYRPQVSALSSADLFRNRETITNVSGLVTPPAEIKVADGSATSWTMGYPLYSAPVITINGQSATVGLQGVDNNHQFYWQPGSASISYDSNLPKLPAGTVLTFTYVGESPVNTTLDNSASQLAQAALELNSGIVDEITSALNSTAAGMNTDQATTFGQGLLDRYGKNDTIEMIGTTRYIGLVPGTTIGLFLPEMMGVWNSQLPIVKLTTMVQMGVDGLIWTYKIDATNGASLTNWARVFYAK